MEQRPLGDIGLAYRELVGQGAEGRLSTTLSSGGTGLGELGDRKGAKKGDVSKKRILLISHFFPGMSLLSMLEGSFLSIPSCTSCMITCIIIYLLGSKFKGLLYVTL